MTDGPGLIIHAVVRNRRSERAFDVLRGRTHPIEFDLVLADKLAAAVTDEVSRSRDGGMRYHAEIVEHLLGRDSLVPAPYGLVARDREAVRRFLRERSVPLLEALDFFAGCYEVRLNARPGVGVDPRVAARLARTAYGELRRGAKAARILPTPTDGRVLSAAFLVERGAWVELVERVEEQGARRPQLRLDATGPWAAYDFVRTIP